jgi:L-fuculose-phosphate aldolase
MPSKKELVEICRRVYEKGFVAAMDGNLSVRISDERFYITRSQVCKGEVTEDDIIEINKAGEKISGGGRVTTEVKIHLLAYNNRPDVNAVVHCHPVYATAFATKGESFEKPVFPEVILTLGKIPLCKYGTPSTNELPESMMPHIKTANAMLLQNHGAVTFGKDIKDAYFKMEKLEHAAKTIFIARLLGGEKSIPGDKVALLNTLAGPVYGVAADKKRTTF